MMTLEQGPSGLSSITPRQLHERLEAGQAVDLIDVRTPAEFGSRHVAAARLAPLDTLDPVALMNARKRELGDPLYVICHSGARGQKACEKFHAAGYRNVFNVAGGTVAWEQAGYPVVRGKRMLSMTQQVLLTAGSMALIGIALGIFVHPGFFVIPVFIAGGLLRARLTGNCPMAKVLARMPWNQAGGNAACEL